MENPLNPRQAQILRFLEDYMDEHGRPPTTREIGAHIGVESTGHVDYHLRALVNKGFITKESHTARGTRSNRILNPVGVPLRGFIAAGVPWQISPEPQEMLDFGTTYRSYPDAFALRVKGQSMIEDLIDDGDLVVVTPVKEARDGETIVAVQLTSTGEHGAATLKRFYKERGQVRLQPANASMQPILIPAREWNRDWEVQARVIAVIRTY